MSAEVEASSWLADFRAGRRSTLEACYRQHFQSVEAAVGRILSGADKETVVHEVFYRVLADGDMRRSFRGGSLGAWLSTVARNRALDYHRRRSRDTPIDERLHLEVEERSAADTIEARLIVEKFRRDHLPAKWVGVFETRFLRQLNQREAADELGISRTTLAYQEHRVRSLLRRFVSQMERE